MTRLVAQLAGDDAAEQRRWQAAASAGWSTRSWRSPSRRRRSTSRPTTRSGAPFTPAQDRDIAAALSSLGYRFDGLGGWVDERVPSQRDLSLALGYAGLDPMRIRHWPTEAEMAELYRDVAVAADEHLAATRRRPDAGRAGRRCSAGGPTGSPSSGTTGAASGPLLARGALA